MKGRERFFPEFQVEGPPPLQEEAGGKPQKQAVAIAYSEAREGKKRRKK